LFVSKKWLSSLFGSVILIKKCHIAAGEIV
jgi:hypothetical protein